MAVYSPINKKELLSFLKQYELGDLNKYEGILEGIENTNYKLETSRKNYILTIFEKRVKTKDLPFFINLKNHLFNKNFNCPQPIKNKSGKNINLINNKSCVLISYLEGKKILNVNSDHCNQVGKILASFHKDTIDFLKKRKNSMGYNQWEKIFIKCKKLSIKKYKDINIKIEKELQFLKDKWPKDLPKGIIHGDVFQDNVFFKDNKFSGLIDFYFSCNDFYAYDIAITINAWCFNRDYNFEADKFNHLIRGYENLRKLEVIEKNNLSILLRGAAIRILITRLHDQLFHPKNAFVEPKNPQEYLSILNFHQNNDIINFLK